MDSQVNHAHGLNGPESEDLKADVSNAFQNQNELLHEASFSARGLTEAAAKDVKSRENLLLYRGFANEFLGSRPVPGKLMNKALADVFTALIAAVNRLYGARLPAGQPIARAR